MASYRGLSTNDVDSKNNKESYLWIFVDDIIFIYKSIPSSVFFP
jgi:hypothetical protein